MGPIYSIAFVNVCELLKFRIVGVRLKKSPTTQNLNNLQASTKEHYRWVPWFILN